MKASRNLLGMIMLLTLVGCSANKEVDYSPSIAALNPGETLVMNYRACHWGCTKGTVKFSDGKAALGRYSIDLSTDEIKNLDDYFILGSPLEEGYRCSTPIKISFKHRRNLRLLNTTDTQIYPCTFREVITINPFILVQHLTETPTETPYWRLSRDEQRQMNTLSVE